MENKQGNILGTQPIGQLLLKFAVPSIIAMQVSALYNIVDQIFIGHSVGVLGNAATNVAFPLSTVCVALCLLFGVGGAANFNLCMGAGDKERARHFVGNAVALLLLSGILLSLFSFILLEPMMRFFGATPDVLGYALEYTGITLWGFPFLIIANGGANLVRADGSPKYSMMCMLVGAIINTVLDPLFIFGFDMGMKGAAWATVIGQVVSGLMVIVYLSHMKTVKLSLSDLKLSGKRVVQITSLGLAGCFNQLAMMVVQITMNNTLTYYGGKSAYGSEIPLACAGIIAKVNMIYFSIIIGISQGLQPIVSFNYGSSCFNFCNGCFYISIFMLPTLPTPDYFFVWTGKRGVFPLCRKLFQNLPFLYLPQRNPADYIQLLYCNRKGYQRCGSGFDSSDHLFAAIDLDSADADWNRWCYVCRTSS